MKRNAKICLSTDTQKHLNGPRVHKESRREFCLIKTDNSHMTTYTENNTLALLYRLAELSYFEKKKEKKTDQEVSRAWKRLSLKRLAWMLL